MPATTVPHQVCNLALSYVGNGQAINSLEENTLEAKQSKIHYGPTRDELLEGFPWRFATRRAVLAPLAEGQQRMVYGWLRNQGTGWEFVYALPADFLAPQYIWSGERRPRPEDEIPFQLEALGSGTNPRGLCLLTDQPEAELIYTAECPAVALWTPTFVQAVAWALAVKLALVVPVKPQLAALADGKALTALKKARAAQLNGQHVDREPSSSITASRG